MSGLTGPHIFTFWGVICQYTNTIKLLSDEVNSLESRHVTKLRGFMREFAGIKEESLLEIHGQRQDVSCPTFSQHMSNVGWLQDNLDIDDKHVSLSGINIQCK